MGTAGIGAAFGHSVGSFGNELLRAGAHGLNNGLISAINGNGFGTGFITGSVASLAGSGAQALNLGSLGTIASTTGAGALGSYISGGNWFDGAMTGLNIGTLNHLGEDDDIAFEGYIPELVVTPYGTRLLYETRIIEKPLKMVFPEFAFLFAGRSIWSFINPTYSINKFARKEIRSWLNNAESMNPTKLRNDLQSAGFQRASQYSEHYKKGDITIRLDKPDTKTPYNHMHIEIGKGKLKTSYDKNLIIVNSRHPQMHI